MAGKGVFMGAWLGKWACGGAQVEVNEKRLETRVTVRGAHGDVDGKGRSQRKLRDHCQRARPLVRNGGGKREVRRQLRRKLRQPTRCRQAWLTSHTQAECCWRSCSGAAAGAGACCLPPLSSTHVAWCLPWPLSRCHCFTAARHDMWLFLAGTEQPSDGKQPQPAWHQHEVTRVASVLHRRLRANAVYSKIRIVPACAPHLLHSFCSAVKPSVRAARA